MKTTAWILLAVILVLPVQALSADKGQTSGSTESAAETVKMEVESDFQPHIFWAYGLVCAILFAFTAYSVRQTGSLGERVSYLKQRFESAFPDKKDPS